MRISLINHDFKYKTGGHFAEIVIGDYVTVLVNLTNNSPMAGIRKWPDGGLQFVYVTGERQKRAARTYLERWVSRKCEGKPSTVLRQQSRRDISGLLEVDIAI
jgi:hypothetical protein